MTNLEFIEWLGVTNPRTEITDEETAKRAVEYAERKISPIGKERVHVVAGFGCAPMTIREICKIQDVSRQAVGNGVNRFKQRLRKFITDWSEIAEEIEEKPVDPDSLFGLEIPKGGATHIRNHLKQNRVFTVTQLCQCTESDILGFRTFGPKLVRYIKEALTERGLSLKAENAPAAQDK